MSGFNIPGRDPCEYEEVFHSLQVNVLLATLFTLFLTHLTVQDSLGAWSQASQSQEVSLKAGIAKMSLQSERSLSASTQNAANRPGDRKVEVEDRHTSFVCHCD